VNSKKILIILAVIIILVSVMTAISLGLRLSELENIREAQKIFQSVAY
jgi:hypothetical protein